MNGGGTPNRMLPQLLWKKAIIGAKIKQNTNSITYTPQMAENIGIFAKTDL